MIDNYIGSISALIVDDDDFMLKLLNRMVQDLGLSSVSFAQNGVQALEILKSEDPHVVLCDLNMPGMDGLEFLRHASTVSKSASFILMSGEDTKILQSAYQLATAHNLDLLGVLPKPISKAALSELLGRYIPHDSRVEIPQSPSITLDALIAGISGGSIHTLFQPKVRASDLKLEGVETLVRFVHPIFGMIPPIHFLGLAEQHGLMDALTEKVFEEAFKAAGEWLLNGLETKVAVNVAIETLADTSLVARILNHANDASVSPRNIILEVTESQLMNDLAGPLEVMARLRLRGVGLSIDDFGTGSATMLQLKRLPFTEMKIDKAFVTGADSDPESKTMLKSAVAMAHDLGLSIVAEGVETQKDLALARELNIELVQGYLIAKPMSRKELLGWAKSPSL